MRSMIAQLMATTKAELWRLRLEAQLGEGTSAARPCPCLCVQAASWAVRVTLSQACCSSPERAILASATNELPSSGPACQCAAGVAPLVEWVRCRTGELR